VRRERRRGERRRRDYGWIGVVGTMVLLPELLKIATLCGSTGT
jgi:hypothetical protein